MSHPIIDLLERSNIKHEVENDGDDRLINIFDKEGLRVCTFCFNSEGILMEVWHGEYQTKYDELEEKTGSKDLKKDLELAEAVKIIVKVFKGVKNENN